MRARHVEAEGVVVRGAPADEDALPRVAAEGAVGAARLGRAAAPALDGGLSRLQPTGGREREVACRCRPRLAHQRLDLLRLQGRREPLLDGLELRRGDLRLAQPPREDGPPQLEPARALEHGVHLIARRPRRIERQLRLARLAGGPVRHHQPPGTPRRARGLGDEQRRPRGRRVRGHDAGEVALHGLDAPRDAASGLDERPPQLPPARLDHAGAESVGETRPLGEPGRFVLGLGGADRLLLGRLPDRDATALAGRDEEARAAVAEQDPARTQRLHPGPFEEAAEPHLLPLGSDASRQAHALEGPGGGEPHGLPPALGRDDDVARLARRAQAQHQHPGPHVHALDGGALEQQHHALSTGSGPGAAATGS